MLIQKIGTMLEKRGFDHWAYSGCFDIIAKKRRDMMLLKVLDNIDSLQESQANNLRVLSRNLGAFACLVGTHTRYERLDDDVIYTRFDVPSFTPSALEHILDGNPPHVYRAKGGFFVEVEPSKMSKAREKKGLTQEELARRVGVTKKSIYEHEHRTMKAIKETVENIEKILKDDLTVPFNLKIEISNVSNNPKTGFEKSVGMDLKKIGFRVDYVYQTPFNIIAKEEILILNDAEENQRRIKRNIPNLLEFSKISDRPVLLITKEPREYDLPSLEKKELKELSAKDLKRIVRKW